MPSVHLQTSMFSVISHIHLSLPSSWVTVLSHFRFDRIKASRTKAYSYSMYSERLRVFSTSGKIWFWDETKHFFIKSLRHQGCTSDHILVIILINSNVQISGPVYIIWCIVFYAGPLRLIKISIPLQQTYLNCYDFTPK